MSTNLDTLLNSLSNFSDSNINKSIIPRIKELIGCSGAEVSLKMKEIIDECIRLSLASKFAISVMNFIWKNAQNEANKNSF